MTSDELPDLGGEEPCVTIGSAKLRLFRSVLAIEALLESGRHAGEALSATIEGGFRSFEAAPLGGGTGGERTLRLGIGILASPQSGVFLRWVMATVIATVIALLPSPAVSSHCGARSRATLAGSPPAGWTVF